MSKNYSLSHFQAYWKKHSKVHFSSNIAPVWVYLSRNGAPGFKTQILKNPHAICIDFISGIKFEILSIDKNVHKLKPVDDKSLDLAK